MRLVGRQLKLVVKLGEASELAAQFSLLIREPVEAAPNLRRLLKLVQVDEPLIHGVLALHHAARVDHVVALPVAQLLVTARVPQVGRLADDQLTHLVDEERLAARQKPK